jgi:DNA-binding transcriptional ArsR family regulator
MGLVGSCCTPSERIKELKSRIAGDETGYRESEEFFSALGDTTRLKMLRIIGPEELCSCEVMAALDLTQPTTSHHLGILERAGILSSRRNGKWVFYRMASPRVQAWLTRSYDLVENTAS